MALETIHEFLTRMSTKTWPCSDYVRVTGFSRMYVRYTDMYIENRKVVGVLQIANVTASRPGKGTFTKFILDFRETYPQIPLMVENVLNKRFRQKLLSLGFRYIGPTEDLPSYFMPSEI